jgi:hypothetical protein
VQGPVGHLKKSEASDVVQLQEPAALRYRSDGFPPEMIALSPITSILLLPMKAKAPLVVPMLFVMVELLSRV